MSETLLNEIRADEARRAVRAARARARAAPPRSRHASPFSTGSGSLGLAPARARRAGDGRRRARRGGGDRADARRRRPRDEGPRPAAATRPRRSPRPSRSDRGLGARRRRRSRRRRPGVPTGDVVPPAPGQLQRYEAELSLRVDDVEALSNATKRAQQIARGHGGSVASLQYDAPSRGRRHRPDHAPRPDRAGSRARSPQLSQLGTIVGQRYGIEDLQQQADSLQSQIEATQRQIAQILGAAREHDALGRRTAPSSSRGSRTPAPKLTGLREALRARAPRPARRRST